MWKNFEVINFDPIFQYKIQSMIKTTSKFMNENWNKCRTNFQYPRDGEISYNDFFVCLKN